MINLGLVLLSFGLCRIIPEIICRVAFRTGAKDYQINNPYYYIEKIATALPYSHYGCYQERVPLEFDHLSYYDSTNGIVHFYSNQFGVRWTEPVDQPIEKSNILVLGDSFTYGHGLHYQDTFVYILQRKLEKDSIRISFVNFARRGVDAEEIFTIYCRFKNVVPHQIVLYGLHINDLIKFTTSYVITNPLALPWLIERSKAFEFIVTRIHKLLIKRYRVRQLTDPRLFKESHFVEKFNALIRLNKAAESQGARLYVVLLPILVDLKKDTLDPLYNGIKSALDQHHIAYFDLTGSLDNFSDQEVWILPFDQHPNHIANKIFADRLLEAFHATGLAASCAIKNDREE